MDSREALDNRVHIHKAEGPCAHTQSWAHTRVKLPVLANKQAQQPDKTRYSSTAKLFLPVAFASYMARSARWIRACASKFSTFSW